MPPLMVYAAASMRDVMVDIAQAYEQAGGGRVAFNFAGSNVLAQQIAAAPGADLYIAANADWIDKLERQGHLVAGSARVIVANALVVVAHRTSEARLARLEDLPELGFDHLSLGDPSSVPAGTYARELLIHTGSASGQDVWSRVRARVAPAPDVRAALAFVEADPNVVGIVYRTDARASTRVKVLLEIPAEREGGAVRYHAALVKRAVQAERVRKLLSFLLDEPAQAIFEQHGFLRSQSIATATPAEER